MTALIPSAALLLSASVFLRPSPADLVILAIEHCQGLAYHIRHQVIPAIWATRHQYRYSIEEVRRRRYAPTPRIEMPAIRRGEDTHDLRDLWAWCCGLLSKLRRSAEA